MLNFSELPLHAFEAQTHNGVRFTISLPTIAVRTSEHVSGWEMCRVTTHAPFEPRKCASVGVMPYAKERTSAELARAAARSAPQHATVRRLADGVLVINEEDGQGLVSVKRYIERVDFDLVSSYIERAHGSMPWYAETRAWAERICMSLTLLAP